MMMMKRLLIEQRAQKCLTPLHPLTLALMLLTTISAWADDIYLNSVDSPITLNDGDNVEGNCYNKQIFIADGATVTLNSVTIDNNSYPGITCLGDATIIFNGWNMITGGQHYPGIQVAKRDGEGEEYTLTIKSEDEFATLTAMGRFGGAGIGSGNNGSCGNIVIESGTIIATIDPAADTEAAGIGSGNNGSCGDITISGGAVTAISDTWAAAIGCGGGDSKCGDITITSGIVSVTAKNEQQKENFNTIGVGGGGTCGTVTINGVVNPVCTNPITLVGLSVDDDIAEGTAGHYYVNMPESGTNTLMLSNATVGTVKVYDDGGKNGSYSNGCKGTLVITAPASKKINVTSNSIALKQTSSDYLNIYDNNEASGTLLGSVIGNTYDGSAINYSTGNHMTLYFESSTAVNDAAGLDLTIKIDHSLTEHPAVAATCTLAGNSAYWDCSICHKYFSDEEGTAEVEENSWVIPATGHDFVNGVCNNCGMAISGTCGATANDNVTWAVTDTDGNGSFETLTISGTGAMANYYSDNQPWAAFKSDITTAVIGNGVTRIGIQALYQFTALTSVSIASSVTVIDASAFSGCTSLATISGASGVTYVESAAFNETAWLNNLPNGLTYVGHVAYQFKGDDTSVTLNTSTTQIYDACFGGSQITSIIIPASVKSIGDQAFAVSALQKIYVLRSGSSSLEITSLGNNPFTNCPNNLVIIVPAAAYNNYDSNWSSYRSKLTRGYTVTGDEGVTATTYAPIVAQGETVTLGYTGEVPTGYEAVRYSINGGTTLLVGNTFEMPASNVTVTVTFVPIPATAPTITTQPDDLELTVGYTSGNTLTVAASAEEGHTITGYQWYSCEDANKTNPQSIENATDASYTVPEGKSVGTTDYYYCVVTATRTDNSQTAETTSNVATVTITKVKAIVTTAPTATNPTYNGDLQALVTGGSAETAIEYVLGENAETAPTDGYSSTIPERTDAGDYYVWYRAKEDDNHAAGVAQCVTVKINKADFYQPEVIPNITKYVPSDKEGSFTIALPALPEGATYSFTETNGDGVIDSHSYDAEHNTLTFTTNSGTTAGKTATITVEAKDAPNYNDYSFTVSAIVSEYTVAYAWPEQTSIWLDVDNELVWAEGGVTLDRSKLTVKKGSTTITDYTAKVGETTLKAGENTLTLDPGAHRISITGDGLDDWVEFKVIKLIEDKTAFSVNVDDCTWPLVNGSGSDAATRPPKNTAELLCNGQELAYSTDTDLDEFLGEHPGLKLWFKDNDHVYGRNPVNKVFTLNSLADGDFYNVQGWVSYNFNGFGSIRETETGLLAYMPGDMMFNVLKDADGVDVPASSTGGRILYLCNERPNLHYVETEGADGTEWALYNGETPVPENQYFRDKDGNVYYGNGNTYTMYNAGSEYGKFISFSPISFIINDSPVIWDGIEAVADPDIEYKFSIHAYDRDYNDCSFVRDECILVGGDFVYAAPYFFYTGNIKPAVVDDSYIQIGDFVRWVEETPIAWLPNSTIRDCISKEDKCAHAYAKYKVGDYSYQVASCSFLIYPNNSRVVISDVASTYKVDEDITCTVTLYGQKTRSANVFLNGEWMMRLEGDDTQEVVLPKLYEGAYLLDVYGDCDEYLTGDHAYTTIYVVKYDLDLTLTGTTPTGETIEYDPDAAEVPEVQYHPENPIVFNAVTSESVSGTSWEWTIFDTDVVTKHHIVNNSGDDAPNSEDIYLNTVGLGEVTLTAGFSGNEKYSSKSTSITFTVVPMAVANPIIELTSDETIYYDGQAKKPAVKVYYAEGKEIPTDQYTVTYENNTNASTEDSKAKIIVKSKTGALYAIDAEQEFVIQKAAVTVTEPPTASAISDGKTLAASTLTGGTAKAGEIDVDGTFAWTDGTVAPTLDDSEYTEYEVTFTPNSTNYATSTCTVKLTVMPRAMLFAENSTNLWATFCGQNDYEVPEGCSAYTISSVSGTTVTLSDALTTIPAYTPMLIKRSTTGADAVTAAFNSVGTPPTSGYDDETGIVTAEVEANSIAFYGNAGSTAIIDATTLAGYVFAYGNDDGKQSYIMHGGDFIVVDNISTTGIGAHRCWLNVSTTTGNARQMSISIGDETTGISSMEDGRSKMEDGWYTLDGRKLNKQPTKKGLYIHNGVKTVIK